MPRSASIHPSVFVNIRGAFEWCNHHPEERRRFFCPKTGRVDCLQCLPGYERYTRIKLRRNLYKTVIETSDLEKACKRRFPECRAYLCNGRRVIYTQRHCIVDCLRAPQRCSVSCAMRFRRRFTPKRAPFE